MPNLVLILSNYLKMHIAQTFMQFTKKNNDNLLHFDTNLYQSKHLALITQKKRKFRKILQLGQEVIIKI